MSGKEKFEKHDTAKADKGKGKEKDGEGEPENETLSNEAVAKKYETAAEIANGILKEIVAKCTTGQSISQLCDFGDQQILARTAAVYKKEKDIKKGLGFPTCISVNNRVCHFSPLRSEPDTKLADGDVVKVDLGVHIDGYIATVAHTVVVGASKDTPITGRKADVILAAHSCLEAAIRLLRPGQYKNMDLTDVIQRIAEAYNCKPVENMLSHQLERYKIDGSKQIIQNPGEKQRQDMEKCEFELYEAYAIDVLVSTGEGKTREMDTRTTVYKRNPEVVYQLKMKASRAFFSEADKRFGILPFTLRLFDDENKSKLGVVECERHGLMKPFPVLHERENEVVAQFKSTVFVMTDGLVKVTGLPCESQCYNSDHKIEDQTLRNIIDLPLKPLKVQKSGNEGSGDATNGPAAVPLKQ